MGEKIKYPFSKQLIFAKVMENESLCKELLERVFEGRKIKGLKLKEKIVPITEAAVVADVRAKSVRLDVLFEDSDAWYDIEMQVENEGNLPKRSRYYSSVLDVKNLKKGQDYNSLKTSFIIFFCLFDYFGEDEAVYFFEKYDRKKALPLGDLSYTIILNTKCINGNISEGLKAVFDYISKGTVTDGDHFIARIHETVKNLQNDEEVDYIMTLEEEYERRIRAAEKLAAKRGLENGMKQGIEQGIEQGMKQGIEQGIEQANKLTQMLLESDRIEDLRSAISNPEYRKKLLEEMNL